MAQTIDSKHPLPCPFCGKKPKTNGNATVGIVKCENVRCAANPRVIGADLPHAIECWNTRP
jgi:hypothetical protein